MTSLTDDVPFAIIIIIIKIAEYCIRMKELANT